MIIFSTENSLSVILKLKTTVLRKYFLTMERKHSKQFYLLLFYIVNINTFDYLINTYIFLD